MNRKLAAVVRATYDRRTGVIEITGRPLVGSVPAQITEHVVSVLHDGLMGWGYDAVIEVDHGTIAMHPLDGIYLASFAEADQDA